MYLKRKIDDYLVTQAEDKERKPLIIKGARQTGKTEAVRHFAKRYENFRLKYTFVDLFEIEHLILGQTSTLLAIFIGIQVSKNHQVNKNILQPNFIEINFALEPKYKMICNDGYSSSTIISNISVINPSFQFIEHKTLIFFDEIQDYPELATSLKSFNEDRRFDCICSGSMLGINYQRIESNSLGNNSEYILESFDFEEFLWAKGYDESISEELLSQMKENKPFSAPYFETFTRLFTEYCIIGGMPRFVVNFLRKFH